MRKTICFGKIICGLRLNINDYEFFTEIVETLWKKLLRYF